MLQLGQGVAGAEAPVDWQRRCERAIEQRSEAGDAEALRLLALRGADVFTDPIAFDRGGGGPRLALGGELAMGCTGYGQTRVLRWLV